MKMTLQGIQNREAWQKAGIALPGYDPEQLGRLGRAEPAWVHFGIGNIFRIFVGGIADRLAEAGELDRGIICAETFDREIVDRIYRPFDNLALNVILHGDGTREEKVIGVFAEAVKAAPEEKDQWARLQAVFASPSLQMATFTITEKGYALRNENGEYYDFARRDLEEGPEKARGAMGVVAAMLLARFRAGAAPMALVSLDNRSRNGEFLRNAVLEMAEGWADRGLAERAFVDYVSDESVVAFPWSMIDKITPRPGEDIARDLAAAGVEDMAPITTARKTFIAPFANAEGPQYLVIEDRFPGGRPPLEKAGVFMTDRETVNRSERMKVTACLNPIHTALTTYDCMLGYELFADGMSDPELAELARRIGYTEGLAVAPDPGILSPRAFLDEVMQERFPNRFLGDTSQRIATDISQMVGIRFGETIRAHAEKEGSAAHLVAEPLAIAGWLRYLLAADDDGRPFELAPDPMGEDLIAYMQGHFRLGHPEEVGEQLVPILSNAKLFGVNLYEVGLGGKIEEMFRAELEGPGAVRRALRKYLGTEAPFRPMRRKKQQIPEAECVRLLKEQPRGVLSVLGDHGYPYGIPMDHWYCERDGKLCFHCAKAGHKLDAIAACEKVSYCVMDEGYRREGEWALNITSVVAFGRIRVVEEDERKREICVNLTKKFTEDEEYLRKELENSFSRVCCLEMEIEHMAGKLVNEA